MLFRDRVLGGLETIFIGALKNRLSFPRVGSCKTVFCYILLMVVIVRVCVCVCVCGGGAHLDRATSGWGLSSGILWEARWCRRTRRSVHGRWIPPPLSCSIGWENFSIISIFLVATVNAVGSIGCLIIIGFPFQITCCLASESKDMFIHAFDGCPPK